jgi:hypothetical protein
VRRLEKREGNWISTDSWIKNVQKNTQTFMIVNDIDFKSKLDDSQFTERALTEG